MHYTVVINFYCTSTTMYCQVADVSSEFEFLCVVIDIENNLAQYFFPGIPLIDLSGNLL